MIILGGIIGGIISYLTTQFSNVDFKKPVFSLTEGNINVIIGILAGIYAGFCYSDTKMIIGNHPLIKIPDTLYEKHYWYIFFGSIKNAF
jgi:hypothetical protein